jgi:hypothetical protein
MVRIKPLHFGTSLEAIGLKKNAFLGFLVKQDRGTWVSHRGTIFPESKTLKFLGRIVARWSRIVARS